MADRLTEYLKKYGDTSPVQGSGSAPKQAGDPLSNYLNKYGTQTYYRSSGLGQTGSSTAAFDRYKALTQQNQKKAVSIYDEAKSNVGVSGLINRTNAASQESAANKQKVIAANKGEDYSGWATDDVTSANMYGGGPQGNTLLDAWRDMLDNIRAGKEAADQRKADVTNAYKDLKEAQKQAAIAANPEAYAASQKAQQDKQRQIDAWGRENGGWNANTLKKAQEVFDEADKNYNDIVNGTAALDPTQDKEYQDYMSQVREWGQRQVADGEWQSTDYDNYIREQEDVARQEYKRRAMLGGSQRYYSDTELTAAARERERAKMVLDYAKQHQYDNLDKAEDFVTKADEGKQLFQQYKQEQLTYTPDMTTIVSSAFSAAQNAGNAVSNVNPYEGDTTFKEPDDRWTDEEKQKYFYLFATDRARAEQYAVDVNRQYNSDAAAERKLSTAESGTRNVGTAILSTLGSVPANIFGGLIDFLNMSNELAGRGGIYESQYVGPSVWAENTREAIAQELNNRGGTIDESVPILGGKGWGDVYQLFTSMVESGASIATGGEVGSLAMFFGMAAASGTRDALERGLDSNKAILTGFVNGLAEVAGEKFSVENLLSNKGLSDFLTKGAFREILKQGGVEASEEVFTTLLNTMADLAINGNESELRAKIYANIVNGMSQEEAQKAALKEWINQLGQDALGGFLSGSVMSGAHFSAFSVPAKLTQYQGNAQGLFDYADTVGTDNAADRAVREAADRYRQRFENTGKISNYGAARMMAATEASMRGEVENTSTRSERVREAVEEAYGSVDEARKAIDQAKDESNTEAREKAVELAKTLGMYQTQENRTGLQQKTTPEQRAIDNVDRAVRALENMDQRRSEREKEGMRESVEHSMPKAKAVELSDGGKVTSARYDSKERSITVTVEGNDGQMRTVDRSELTGESAQLFDDLEDMLGNDSQVVEAFNMMQDEQDARYYGTDFRTMRYAGQQGVNFDTAMKDYKGVLTEEQARLAYTIGQSMTKQEGGKPIRTSLRGTGKVSLDGGMLNGKMLQGVKNKASLQNSADYKLVQKIAKALGVDVVFYESQTDAEGRFVGAQGAYQGGVIYLDVNAGMNRAGVGERMFFTTLSHELTHFIKANAPARYAELQDRVIQHLMQSKGIDFNGLVREKMARTDERLTYDAAVEEVIADSCETMLRDSKAVQELAQDRPRLFRTMKQYIDRFASKILVSHAEAKALIPVMEEVQQIWDKALTEAVANRNVGYAEDAAVWAMGEDAEVERNEKGELLLAKSENGSTLVYSERTYLQGGREKLKQALKQNGHTQEEIESTLHDLDRQMEFLHNLGGDYAVNMGYEALSNHLQAEIVSYIKSGDRATQALSTLVNNGEYPVNLDLALICKKRVAYMRMMTKLIEDGVFGKVKFEGAAIADVNKILRDNGFETACLGCFVEARRLQLQKWAETIVKEWNAAVDQRNPGAGYFGFSEGLEKFSLGEIADFVQELENAGEKNDKGNVKLNSKSVAKKMGELQDRVPSLRKKLTVADLLTPKGMSMLRSYDQNLFSLVKQRYGAASPKIVQEFNPYNSEIADLGFDYVKDMTGNAVKGAREFLKQAKEENPRRANESDEDYEERVETIALRNYLYKIGGARVQSFSDFMIENIFDYLQILNDLAARELPMHGYSKEASFLRIFGMTGIKINGSWIAHTERSMGKEYAGLLPVEEASNGRGIVVTIDGEQYAICMDDYARHQATGSFIQSIGMKDMVALQLDPRYSANVGSITIGVSDKQILAMLDSDYFRMVIPYHSSGMLKIFAELVGVDSYNDYTKYQNTRVKSIRTTGRGQIQRKVNAKTGKEKLLNSKGKELKVDTSFAYNEAVQRLGDARAAADEYLRWCAEEHPVYDDGEIVGYATFSPKFSDSPYHTDFTTHPNYYKLLEDFNSYDMNGESALQGAAKVTLPSVENRMTAEQMEAYKQALRNTGLFTDKEVDKYAKKADMTFEEIVAEEVHGRAVYESTQAKVWDKTVEEVEKTLLENHPRTKPAAKKKAAKNGGAKMSERDGLVRSEVEAALWDAMSHGDKGDDNLISAGRMPRFVRNITGIDGDLYLYRNHIFEDMVSREDAEAVGRGNDNARFHDIGIEQMTEAVMSLDRPLMSFKAWNRDGNPTMIEVLPVYGKSGAPLYAVMSFYANQPVNGSYVKKPHIVLTIAERNWNRTEGDGRDGLSDVIKDAIDNDNVLSITNEMRAELSVNAMETSHRIITDSALMKNIAQFRKEINSFKQQNKINYSERDRARTDREYMNAVERGDMETAQRMVDAAAKAAGYNRRAFHGTVSKFWTFRRGKEGIHFGTIEQAEQTLQKDKNRHSFTDYSLGIIRHNIDRFNKEQLTNLAYDLEGLIWRGYSDIPEIPNNFDYTKESVRDYIDKIIELYPEAKTDAKISMKNLFNEYEDRIIDAYVKMQHPMTFPVDIGEWTTIRIADALLHKLNNQTDSYYRYNREIKDGDWQDWNPADITGIELTEEDRPALERMVKHYLDYEELVKFLQSKGVDSIEYTNMYEGTEDAPSYLLLDPEQVKLADTVTYDDNGNVIPLSERFNSETGDIRYSERDNARTDRELLMDTTGEELTAAERRELEKYRKKVEDFEERERKVQAALEELDRMVRAKDPNVQKQRSKVSNLQAGMNKALRELTESETKDKTMLQIIRKEREIQRLRTSMATRETFSKRELRGRITRLYNDLNRRITSPSEKKNIPVPVMMQAIDVLEAINMDSSREGSKAGEQLRNKLLELQAKYKQLQNDPDFRNAAVYDEFVAELLTNMVEEVGDTPINRMNASQMKAVYDALTALDKTARKALKIQMAGEERDAYMVSKQMGEETRSVAKPSKGKLAQWLNAQLSPERMFNRLGGYHKDSAWSQVYRMLNDGQLKMTQVQMEATMLFDGLLEGKDYDRFIDPKVTVDIGLKDKDGKAIPITHGMMVALYMHMQNDQNVKHVTHGGITVPNLRDYYNGKNNRGLDSVIHAVGVSQEIGELRDRLHEAIEAKDEQAQIELKQQIREAEERSVEYAQDLIDNIEKNLSDYDRQWIAASKELFDVYSKQRINEATMDVYGIKRANVDNYFPLAVNKDFLNTPFESIAKDMSLENAGFVKERVDSGKPIYLFDVSDVAKSQIRRVSQYCGLMPVTRNFQKIWGKVQTGYRGSLQDDVRDKFGTAGIKYIENLMADLNGARGGSEGPLADFFNAVRGNMAQASLTLSLRTAMGQTASYPTAASVVGWKALGKALARGGKGNTIISRADQELIRKYSPLLWYRMKGYSTTELGDIADSNSQMARLWKKMRWATGWIQAMDGATVGRLWYAAQYYVDDHNKALQKGTDAYYKEVAKVFNDIVERTQPDYTTMQRPDILRNPNALVRQLTMFLTQRLQNFNILYDAAASYTQAKKDLTAGRSGVTQHDVLEARTTVRRAAVSQIVAAATITAFKILADGILHSLKAYRDDDEDLTPGSVSMEALDMFIDSLAGNMLGGGEIYDLIEKYAFGKTYYGIEVSGVSTVTDVVESATKFLDEAMKEGATPKEVWNKGGHKLAKNISSLLGVPYANGEKIVMGLIYHTTDIVNGEFLHFEAGVERTTAQQAHRLYRAYAASNFGTAKKIREEVDDDKSLNKALTEYIKQQYKDGAITQSKAADQLTRFAGKDRETAIKTMRYYSAEVETGIKYDNIGEELTAGNLSKTEAVKMWTKYGGMDSTTANSKAEFTLYKDKYPNTKFEFNSFLTYYTKYRDLMSPEMYEDYYDSMKACKGTDKNNDGKTDSGSAKAQKLLVIDQLPLSKDKKDALYKLNGWSEKTLKDAPWNK